MKEKVGMNQNAISRLENPYYGKATITTLKRIAAAFDVGLVVEFVPFSKLVKKISGTPYVERGLSPESLDVPSFDEEEKQGVLDHEIAAKMPLIAEGSGIPPESFEPSPSYIKNLDKTAHPVLAEVNPFKTKFLRIEKEPAKVSALEDEAAPWAEKVQKFEKFYLSPDGRLAIKRPDADSVSMPMLAPENTNSKRGTYA